MTNIKTQKNSQGVPQILKFNFNVKFSSDLSEALFVSKCYNL